MGPERLWWWDGWWFFPMLRPFLMVIPLFMALLVALLVALRLACGRGNLPPPWGARHPATDTALDLLNKRYAKGELTQEEYADIKRDSTA